MMLERWLPMILAFALCAGAATDCMQSVRLNTLEDKVDGLEEAARAARRVR